MTHIDQIPEAAIERLWREHSRDLVRLATVLVGPTDAHDIVVDAFLRAAPAADRPAVSNARAFLMRSVVNRAHDLRRSRERRGAGISRQSDQLRPAVPTASSTFGEP